MLLPGQLFLVAYNVLGAQTLVRRQRDKRKVHMGLAMDTNMKAPLCVQTLENAVIAYPDLRGAIIHSDRGSQYTSQLYRDAISKFGIQQSMNSAGGRCHDNARCESMWASLKTTSTGRLL